MLFLVAVLRMSMVVAVQLVVLEPLDNNPAVAEDEARVVAAGIELWPELKALVPEVTGAAVEMKDVVGVEHCSAQQAPAVVTAD